MSEVVTQMVCESVVEVTEDVQEDSPTGELVVRRNEHGMVSAEWAVGIIAAIAIAGVLLAVVTNGAVKDALLKFVLFIISKFAGYFGG